MKQCCHCLHIAEDNKRGGSKTGFIVDGVGNSMELIDCRSINNDVGYRTVSDTTAKLVDCKTMNDRVSTYGSGFTVINTSVVEV